MINVKSIAVMGGIALLLGAASDAGAQLFGERSLGRPLSRRSALSSQSPQSSRSSSSSRSSPSSQQGRSQSGAPSRSPDSLFEDVGSVDETARYLRGNRQITDFVGADSAEATRLVGVQQAGLSESGVDITSAVDELQIETAPDANQTAQPVLPAPTGMYPPRLQLGFIVNSPAGAAEFDRKLVGRLQSALSLEPSSSIEVSVEDGVAILRGEVPSERDRRMAGLLMRFEPGIADVQNELTVSRAAGSQPMRPNRS